MTNFGASFKKARESKGISLDQIAKETRISTRFLAAIENEEFHLLPGGIFNRGFVRSFAEAVGLDPDQAVADYAQLSSVPVTTDVPTSATTGPPKSGRYLYPFAIGMLAVAVVIFYVTTRESRRTSDITPQRATVPATQPVAPPREPQTTPAPAPAIPSERILAPSPKTQVLRLEIEAREKTWIKVASDGNSVNAGEVLEPGMTRKFTAENSIKISIGNAAGLTLRVNDMSLKPLGKTGQVRFLTITPANLKDFIG